MKAEQIRKRIEGLKRFSSPPAALDRILDLTSDTESLSQHLAEAVEADPALAARVLRIANSAYFGFPRQIETLDHALVLLGQKVVRGIATSVALAPLFRDGHDPLDRETLWLHSCAVAEAARLLATHTETDSGIAYVAGLLHDVGKVALAEALPSHYARVVEHERRFCDGALEAETKTLNVDHAWAGGVLLGRWNLPERLVAAVAYHHAPSGQEDVLPALVQAADQLACMEGFCGPSEGPAPTEVSPRCLGALGLSSETLEQIQNEFRERGESIEALYHASSVGG